MVRPTVGIHDIETPEKKIKDFAMPAVFSTPLRMDMINFVHTQMAKNDRQAYAVYNRTGHEYAAESWGTGRAVARIPRIKGSGSNRNGQGAFGNMCRGGRMYNPTKIWRRWHRKVNLHEKRFAVAAAVASTGITSLVSARGHKIDKVQEIPLIADSRINQISKTKEAIKFLEKFGLKEELERVKESKKIRAGKGKMRNRRYVLRRGPLIVYNEQNKDICRAFRNIPGVELCAVDALNLLQLAPGGHVGRLVIWAQDAFERLNEIFGTQTTEGKKKGFKIPYPIFASHDVSRVLRSNEIRKVLRKKRTPMKVDRKKNPLKNLPLMIKLNPHAATLRRNDIMRQLVNKKKKAQVDKKRRKIEEKDSKNFYNAMYPDNKFIY